MNAYDIAKQAIAKGASQKLAEFRSLIELVHELQPAVILEIGSMNGGSIWAWEQAVPDAEIISVSLTNGPFGGGKLEVQVNHHLDSDSHDPETLTQVLAILDGRPVDFLFIDADHTYEGVRQDFTMYGWLVRRGGLIGFHDIVPHPADTGINVKELWDELKRRFDTEEFVVPVPRMFYGAWAGIGVVRW